MRITAFPIIEVRRDVTGAINVKFDGKEKPWITSFSEIRAGVAWPLRSCPAYFCLIGLIQNAKPTGKGALAFILEEEHPTFVSAMESLTNTCKDFRFGGVYTDRTRLEWIGFNSEFDSICRRSRDYSDIRLQGVPFCSDFTYGINTIQSLGSSEALVIPPQTLLKTELHSMGPQDLITESPEYKFYALNALRFVLVSYARLYHNPHGKGAPVPRYPEEGRPRVGIVC